MSVAFQQTDGCFMSPSNNFKNMVSPIGSSFE